MVVINILSIAKSLPDISELPAGPYCAGRYPAGRCCAGRQDECSAPILATTCYCDDFCDRHGEEDCCPDYWSHCKGVEIATPPPPPPEPDRRCFFERKYYNYGQQFKRNCNLCNCTSVGMRAEVVCEQNRCLQERDLIEEINLDSPMLGWRARNYSEFSGRTLNEGVKLRLGTLNPSRVHKTYSVPRIYESQSLPREFDARSRWPRYISAVKDQGWCGASWAISSADVASDRFSIMSMGVEDVELSAQHLLSCNNRGQRGCDGGYLDRAWMFMRKFGLVEESCYPWTGTSEQCKLRKRTDLRGAGCPVASNSLRTELYKTGPAYHLGNETDIMQEILTSGPVQATLRVYQDFFSYESGVYKRSAIADPYESGYHSVRIIGWGEEQSRRGSPVKYWLVMNSWGRHWGEDGLFRIQRGTNECEIESFVLGVWAKTALPLGSKDIRV